MEHITHNKEKKLHPLLCVTRYVLPRRSGYTLMELLIVVAMVAAIAVVVLTVLDPKKQIEKGWDTKRKTELTFLSKKLDDWYNDKGCYPLPNEICYNTTSGTPAGTVTCNVCGKHTNSPTALNKYVGQLACDPEYPRKNYVYETENSTCPTWFRIYSSLGYQTDSIIASLGCLNGCGPGPNYAYNFGVSSPNINLEINPLQPTNTPTPTAVPPTSGPTSVPPTTDPGFFPTLTPIPTAAPSAAPTAVPEAGACISQFSWGSCNHYCSTLGKICFSSSSGFTYKGYNDASCGTSSTVGCISGAGGCCNSWPFVYTQVICYCQ